MLAPNALGLDINELVAYSCPKTNKAILFTVVGFGTSRSKGSTFTVIYDSNPGVEVELSEKEVKEILARRVYQLED